MPALLPTLLLACSPAELDTAHTADTAHTDGGARDTADTATEAPLPVYLLTGQSNSLGTTQFEGDTLDAYGPGTDPADAATAFFWSNVSAANLAWPPALYGDSGGQILPLQVQQGGGADPAFWGPEFGLARTLAAQGESELLVIKASRGGGGNTLWHRPAFEADPDTGHMWGHLAQVSAEAVAQLGDRPLRLRALLYMQGESNSDEEADLAGERLVLLADEVAALYDGLSPGSAEGMQTVIAEIAASSSTGARARTTQQQQRLAEGDPDVHFVQTHDLPLKEDGIHFGRDAKLEIGARMAAALPSGALQSGATADAP